MYVQYLFWALASCRFKAYSAHTLCESMNSLSHGMMYLSMNLIMHWYIDTYMWSVFFKQTLFYLF